MRNRRLKEHQKRKNNLFDQVFEPTSQTSQTPLIPFLDRLTCQCTPLPATVKFGYKGSQLLPSPDKDCPRARGDTSPRNVFVVMEASTQPREELSPQPITDNRVQNLIYLSGTTSGCHSSLQSFMWDQAEPNPLLKAHPLSASSTILFGFCHFLSFF